MVITHLSCCFADTCVPDYPTSLFQFKQASPTCVTINKWLCTGLSADTSKAKPHIGVRKDDPYTPKGNSTLAKQHS